MKREKVLKDNKLKLILGEGFREFKSSNQTMFQPYEIKKVEELTELKEELRSIICL